MILSARGLSWSVAGKKIVQDVDLEARPGQVVGLMGPNGSGKSTVMRFLAGTARADRGTVRLDGLPGRTQTAALMRRWKCRGPSPSPSSLTQ